MSKDNIQRVPIVDKNGKLTHVYKSTQTTISKKSAAPDKPVLDMTLDDFLEHHRKTNKTYRDFAHTFEGMVSYSPYEPDLAISEKASSIINDISKTPSLGGDIDEAYEVAKASLSAGPQTEYHINNAFILRWTASRNRRLRTFTLTHVNQMAQWDIRSLYIGLLLKDRSYVSENYGSVRLDHNSMYALALEHLKNDSQAQPNAEDILVVRTVNPLVSAISEMHGGVKTGALIKMISAHPEHFQRIPLYNYWERDKRDRVSDFESSFNRPSWNLNALHYIANNLADRCSLDGAAARNEAAEWMFWIHNAVHIRAERLTGGRDDPDRITEFSDLPFSLAAHVPFSNFLTYYDAGITDASLIIKAYESGIDASLVASISE